MKFLKNESRLPVFNSPQRPPQIREEEFAVGEYVMLRTIGSPTFVVLKTVNQFAHVRVIDINVSNPPMSAVPSARHIGFDIYAIPINDLTALTTL